MSNSTIEGIAVNCPAIQIAKTLSKTQQQQLVAFINSYEGTSYTNTALANVYYKEALGISTLDGYTDADIINGVFEDASTRMSRD